MRTRAEIIHHEAAMLDFNHMSSADLERLKAARYYIDVALGNLPKPATDMDMAANAEAAKYETV